MNFCKYFLTTTILSSITMTAPANADVSADDVLAMFEAYYGRMGTQLSAETSRSGDTLNLSNWTMNIQLPMGFGQITASLDTAALIENSDGTVEISYPETANVQVTAKIGEEPEIAFDFIAATENLSVIASGDPDDLTISYSTDRMEFLPSAASAQLLPDEMEISGVISGMRGSTHIVDGEVMQVAADNVIDNMQFGFDGTDPAGGASSTNAIYTDMVTKTSLSLPNGMSILNLSAALRDGLAAQIIATSSGTSSRTEVTGGPIQMMQEMTQGNSDIEYLLDENGLRMAGTADTIAMQMSGLPDMPLPISARLGSADFNLVTPLNASEDEQEFALGLSLNDIEVDDSLWSLIDPSRALPRDPAQLTLDVDGRAKTFVDLLDFFGLMAAGQSDEIPGELNSLRLKDLRIALAGADLSGSGTFTFDNADLVTFGGLPRPEGAIDLALTGANGLMDTLVQMGLLPEDQAMSARMMMGLFSVPGTGDDTLTSTIEINSEGHVLANGQRLK